MDEVEISARNLMLCLEVTFDTKDPAAPYSLHHVLSTIRAVDPESIKLSKPICAYVEYFGFPGEYEVWIDVVFLGYDEMMEEVEGDVVTYEPFDLNLSGDGFVEGRFYCLRHVPFIRQDIYETQLTRRRVRNTHFATPLCGGVTMIRKGPSQPKAPRSGRINHEIPLEGRVAQEMADPWGHLSEAMKKKIFGDAGPPTPPTPSEPVPTDPAPKPTES